MRSFLDKGPVKKMFPYHDFLQPKPAIEAELAKIGQDTAEEFVSMYEVLFGDVEKSAEQKGIEEGLQQGKIQEAFLVFRNGLRKGVGMGLLAELTNIPLPLAERWKARLDQNPELTWEEIDAQFFWIKKIRPPELGGLISLLFPR